MRTRDRPKVMIDVFPDWLSGGGIFSELQNFSVPWKDGDVDISQSLDYEYYGNISGDKPISPLVKKIMSGDSLTELEINLLASTIVNVCGVNWFKQWETIVLEYSPIENYSMTEIMTDDETVTEYGRTETRTDNLSDKKTGNEIDTPNITESRTDNLTHGKTGTETRTDDLTDAETPNLTTVNSTKVNGFNSTNAVPSGEETGTATGTNTIKHSGTESKQYNISESDSGTQTQKTTGTDSHEYNITNQHTGTQVISNGGEDIETRNYLLTRKGNIGVTTSQQMIESERNLWEWNFFHNVVFPDVDRILTLCIY